MTAAAKPIALLVSAEYPPYTHGPRASSAEQSAARLKSEGYDVEIIARSRTEEEFIHLDSDGNLVHRVSGLRTYALKPLGRWRGARGIEPLAFSVRALERALELVHLWNRHIVKVEGLPFDFQLPRPAQQQRQTFSKVTSADLIVCTYRRLPELKQSLPSLLRESKSATLDGLPCTLTLVHQEEGLAQQLATAGIDTSGIQFVFSSPPSLTRARNEGLQATHGDLAIFVDDDVVLDENFVLEHVHAANQQLQAIGVVGGIRSRAMQERNQVALAVGQIRPSGYVDGSFESLESEATLVPQTPMGANMAFRRDAMNALLGSRWFDERFTGTAFREETTMALDLFRRGQHLVFAPRASLFHFESVEGGCENRTKMSREKQIQRYGLEYLFLNRLYAPSSALRAVGPLMSLARDVRMAQGAKDAVERLYLNARGYLRGRQLHQTPTPHE